MYLLLNKNSPPLKYLQNIFIPFLPQILVNKHDYSIHFIYIKKRLHGFSLYIYLPCLSTDLIQIFYHILFLGYSLLQASLLAINKV